MDLENQLAEKYGEFLEKHPSGTPMIDIFDYPERDAVELKLIQVSKENRGSGIGSQIMEEITDWADANNKIVVLSPSEVKRNKLIKWYKTFDFVENKGRNKDFRFMNRMIRYPQGNSRSKWVKEAEGGYKIKNDDHIEIVNLVIDTLEEAKELLNIDFEIADLMLMGSQTSDKENPDDIDVYARIVDIKDNEGELDNAPDDLVHALWETIHDELQPYYNGTVVDITVDQDEFINMDELSNPQPLIIQSANEIPDDILDIYNRMSEDRDSVPIEEQQKVQDFSLKNLYAKWPDRHNLEEPTSSKGFNRTFKKVGEISKEPIDNQIQYTFDITKEDFEKMEQGYNMFPTSYYLMDNRLEVRLKRAFQKYDRARVTVPKVDGRPQGFIIHIPIDGELYVFDWDSTINYKNASVLKFFMREMDSKNF